MNQTYIVKKGDTLYGISNQFGVSVTELASLNKVNANTLQVGQELMIPNSSGTNPNNMFMYTVKAGDTLYGIAKKYNTSVEALKDINYFTSNALVIGQVIRIPEMYYNYDEMLPPNYINYVVKKGDTLYTIARDNNVSVDTIMKDNGLTNTYLVIGQTLKLRVSSEAIDNIEECFGEEYIPVETNNNIVYIVKRGDSLYQIAKKYNTSVSNIMKLNNLKSINLSIGQELKIPNSSSSVTYIVKKGDSLYSIASKFNTTVNNIKIKNNLNSNLLSIGQQLMI